MNDNMKPWYATAGDDVLAELQSAMNELADEEAARRLQEYGRNSLSRSGGTAPLADPLATD